TPGGCCSINRRAVPGTWRSTRCSSTVWPPAPRRPRFASMSGGPPAFLSATSSRSMLSTLTAAGPWVSRWSDGPPADALFCTIAPRIDKLLACLRRPAGASSRGLEEGVAGLAERGVTDPGRIASAIDAAFAAGFGVGLGEDSLRPDEEEAARALARAKYQSAG